MEKHQLTNNKKFIPITLYDEMSSSYLSYAMSVIVSRALPDSRDGLKPVHRRIIYAMYKGGFDWSKQFRKSARPVADVMGKYHPHGDQAIYDALVRMAQDFSMSLPLVEGQGNFGSIDGDPPAAMRYTECRLSKVTQFLINDIEKNTIEFRNNYDDTEKEPVVLPSQFPNLLVNGAGGIAVGMATSIPPHNLGEIIDGTIDFINNREITISQLMKKIPGPDFPTGGIICGRAGIRRGYHTGRSTIVVRARAKIEEHKKKRFRIVVSEIPYQQFRDRVVERIAGLVNDGRIPGITGIRDESDLKEPVRLVIDLKRDADPDVVLNQLYQFSPLQDSFSIIFLSLVDGRPRVLSLKAMLQEFIRHRVSVIRRRTQFLLARARREKHRIEGLLLALANIDEIIRIIRHSQTQAEAKVGLMGVECPAAMLQRALGERGFRGADQSWRGWRVRTMNPHDALRQIALEWVLLS